MVWQVRLNCHHVTRHSMQFTVCPPLSHSQIDDFLNGKHPLSVAIRMGESVVVVNLHRAKVEEDAEPPQKRRCVRTHRLSQDTGYCSSFQGPSSLSPPSSSSLSSAPGASSLSCPAPSSTDFRLNSNPRLSTSDAAVDPSPSAAELAGGSSAHMPAAGSHRECSDEPCCSYTHSQPLPPQPLPRADGGVSMKRKAVMEAISEILKKMYASSEKGRLPGSFKGRFSSEFTCNNDMNDIVHTKTTMAREGEAGKTADLASTSRLQRVLSKANFEENEHLKGKVAQIKYRMQQLRAVKAARRRVKGGKSPCGWMERLNCEAPAQPPQALPSASYCGLKKGFLLS